ncbi:hypothetical protein QAD02_007395 [Eretmocerus hayati]|uniref:Uncharacterized protein n=1 Tax=Eretmocerus hayati TaxID=131215 RepID=A0ACC2N4T3_9HYME|nr:hypothetical protein QAD02_007395 [Eretmocerus hayati]
MGERGGPLATSTQLSPMAQKLMISQTMLSQPSKGLAQEAPAESYAFATRAKSRKLGKPPIRTVPKACSTVETAVLAQFKKPRSSVKQVNVQEKEIAQKSLAEVKDATVSLPFYQKKPSSGSAGIFLTQEQLRDLQQRWNSGTFDPKDFSNIPQDSRTSTQSQRTLDSGKDTIDEDLDEDGDTRFD